MKSPNSGSDPANRRDFFAEVTGKIMCALEQGCAPWVRPWSENPGTSAIPISASGRQYRGINRILLGMEQSLLGYNSPQWYTRKMANQAGGHIRKGEKGTPIVFFKPVDKSPSEPEGPDPDDNNDSTGRFWVHRFYYVWNRDQLEGVDGAPAPEPMVQGPRWHLHRRSDYLALGTDAKFEYGGNRAYYSPGADRIVLPLPDQFYHEDDFHSTRFHELVHWTGHTSRLGRRYGRFGDPDYAREELVAEMGAAFLCEWCGLLAELQHPEYIASWLRVLDEDKSAVIVAASQAQKAFDFILEQSGMNEEVSDLRKAA
ncbi:MAG: DUF1738 domain-containing protein [Gammaproteobacteria bacterium]|nr:DUF1738 domain-containing protein [Gammaproteobacteria bacterium]MYH91136.1 DUF1738 domain-containing protein [Gammaproteobacteria bacterium]